MDSTSTGKDTKTDIKIEKITEFKNSDLNDICDATEKIISDNSLSFTVGYDKQELPSRERLENFWKGVLLVPERVLIVGRLDGIIASSVQLIKPAPSNQTSSFAGQIESHFVVPWARGFGLAKELLRSVEKEARNVGLGIIRISVRENLEAAIKLYESFDYKRWGTLDKYEKLDGKMYAGHFYYKELS